MRVISAINALDRDFRRKVKAAADRGGFTNLRTQAPQFIQYMMKDYVFTQDPGIEMYVEPRWFIEEKIGDCDDAAIFVAALLTYIRWPNELIYDRYDGQLMHVRNRAYIGELQDSHLRVDFDFTRPKFRTTFQKVEGPAPKINYKITEQILRKLYETGRINRVLEL